MTKQITIPLALMEQLVGALQIADNVQKFGKAYSPEALLKGDTAIQAALTAGRAALEGAERAGWQPTCKQDLQVLFPRHTPHRIDNWTIAPAFLTRVLHTIAPDTPYDFIPTMEQVEQVLLAIEVIPTAEYIAAPAPQAQPICKLFGTLPVYDSPAPQPAQEVEQQALDDLSSDPAIRAGGHELGDYLRRIKRNPARAAALANARQRLAQSMSKQIGDGCACRWDANDNRVATCVRHQGWLDVVSEWADRAKAAEAALQSAQPAVANIQTKIVKDISAHEGGKQQLPPLPTTEPDARRCAYCNHTLFLGSKCKNCGRRVADLQSDAQIDADIAKATEKGAEAWAGVDPQELRTGLVPLTDVQINVLWDDAFIASDPTANNHRFKFARALEAAHGIGVGNTIEK